MQLLLEVHLFALNESLVLVNRYTHSVLQASGAAYRAKYIACKYAPRRFNKSNHELSHALNFGLCTEPVLDIIVHRLLSGTPNFTRPYAVLPRRLFRNLRPRAGRKEYDINDAPLPFLRHLYAVCSSHGGKHQMRLRVDHNDGYPLSRAVHASHKPLVRFLLAQRADPCVKDALAVRIAISKRDLSLVTMLIERDGEEEQEPYGGRGPDSMPVSTKRQKSTAKRPRLTDRMQVTNAMLKDAVGVDARDIVEYLMDKGARPDMQTLQQMQRSRLF